VVCVRHYSLSSWLEMFAANIWASFLFLIENPSVFSRDNLVYGAVDRGHQNRFALATEGKGHDIDICLEIDTGIHLQYVLMHG
jgi:hypothetical protein